MKTFNLETQFAVRKSENPPLKKLYGVIQLLLGTDNNFGKDATCIGSVSRK